MCLQTTIYFFYYYHTEIYFSLTIHFDCPNLCEPMDCSMPGFPVHQQLPELTQTHVHRVSDAIQPSHPLSSLLLPRSISPSIRVFSNESVLLNKVAKLLECQFQNQYFQ